MMKNFIKIATTIFALFLVLLTISSCANNESSDKEEIAKNIIKTVTQYKINTNNDFEVEYERMIKSIENSTDSEFKGDIGFGNYIFRFERSDNISFEITGFPFHYCEVYFGDESYANYEINNNY